MSDSKVNFSENYNDDGAVFAYLCKNRPAGAEMVSSEEQNRLIEDLRVKAYDKNMEKALRRIDSE